MKSIKSMLSAKSVRYLLNADKKYEMRSFNNFKLFNIKPVDLLLHFITVNEIFLHYFLPESKQLTIKGIVAILHQRRPRYLPRPER